MIITDEITKRFWTKVAVGDPDECWPYLGHINSGTGYGHFGTKYPELVGSHRYAFACRNGDPGKSFVRHTCDNRPCCNPNHLLAGSHKQNMQDMVDRKRHVGNREINEIIALEIRQRRATGATTRELAKEYGLSPQHVSNICTGVYWPDVGGPLTRRFEMSDELILAITIDLKNMSQAACAVKYDVSKSAVQQIASGKRRPRFRESLTEE